MTMIIGQTIGGHYHIKESLSQGGFGETYVAEDIHLPGNPQFVVKKLKPQSTDPFVLQTARRLFEKESQVLHRLGKCDRIPQLFAHFEEDQEFYLVQELIVGHDLSDELVLSNQPGVRGTQLTENEVMQLLQDILEALAVVHQQGVIHRDIKPSNLMRRDSDGKIILIDFGAVKEISTQLKNTQAQPNITVPIGTEGYMPNEQMNGYPRLSSDIYAVGMVGIQALTGVSPDRFPKNPDTLEVIWREQALVSPKLANFLDSMIRYRHSDRYQSADEALQVIKSLVSGSIAPTIVSPAPWWPSLKLSNFQPKLKLIIGLISLGIGVISAVAVSHNIHKIQPKSGSTSTPAPSKEGVW
ncbi:MULTISPECIES: serine/threonine-protein kinase [unclassified Microcoleus]|uniref:serine/threonine-protein kinase n=1 Tax=unclassified Microcoleus TaxID=2642155 RepID=UPI002FD660FC